MSERTFSIRSLLVIVAMAAVAIAAVWHENFYLLGIIANSLVAYLCLAMVLSISHREPDRRIPWVGRAIFGWVFLLMYGHPGHFLLDGTISHWTLLLSEWLAVTITADQSFHLIGVLETAIIFLLSLLGGFLARRMC